LEPGYGWARNLGIIGLSRTRVKAVRFAERATKLYDRASDEITLDEVERIAI
jgi:hypothetical protein